jgi:hypothetical protein
MATVVISQTGAAAHRRADLALGRTIAAGLMVGTAEGLFFALALARTPVERAIGRSAMSSVDIGAMALILIAPVAAGWAFAVLTRRHVDTDVVPRWHLPMSGVLMLLASTLGVVIASMFESQSVGPSQQLVRSFQIAFVLASGTAAFVCSWGVARLLRVDGALTRATLIGLATATTYLLFAVFIDTLPGWRVGGGDMAMPRVAMLGNLISGTVGGSLAFQLLRRR